MRWNRNAVAVMVLCLGVVFLAIGTMRGEAAMVLQKAVVICMECVGIG